MRFDIKLPSCGTAAAFFNPVFRQRRLSRSGKGFVFLPDSMKLLRPFGVTAQVGYSFPTESSAVVDNGSGPLITTRNPQFLVWGGSLQYSMPYLKLYVEDFGLPGLVIISFQLSR